MDKIFELASDEVLFPRVIPLQGPLIDGKTLDEWMREKSDFMEEATKGSNEDSE